MPAAPLSEAAALGEIARAARVLWIRSRREASELFAGSYASAFRGGGIEFEESRPYVPGDDVRSIDWNATARTGQPWVKRFREERSRTVLLLLDVSASMAFGTTGRSKAALAAHAAALLAAAAGRAGDRLGLVCFGADPGEAVEPGRGPAHTWRVIRRAVAAAAAPGGGTRLDASFEWVRRHARRRAVVILLSDLRDEALFGAASPDARRRGRLATLAHRYELVAVGIEDPRERRLPAAGAVRLVDPERPGRRLVLGAGRAAVRRRYAAAAEARRREVESRLRQAGIDFVWLSTAGDPLQPLVHFFQRRAGHPRAAR